MKYTKSLLTLAGTLAAVALLVGVSTGTAHAQTSTTTTATSTASTTAPTITSVSAASSADGTNETISWLTNVNANSQVAYGSTSAYSASTTLSSNMTTDHTVVIPGLIPSTTYHFQAISSDGNGNTATSADQTFTTSAASTTNTGGNGTGSSTTVADLQNQVTVLQSDMNSLQARLNMIWQELSALLGGNNGGNNGGNTGGGTVVTGTPSIMPSSVTVPAGSTSVVDFNGRNFGHEEQVTISRNGQEIGSAHADGGGNFSTGSMSLPTSAGTYTYTFTGAHSGTSLTSTVTVQ